MVYKAKIKELLSGLFKLNNKPTEIALGVSIGVIIAIMPLYGFHTLLCVIFYFLIPYANKIAILVGTNISLPPTLPLITWAGYNIGRLILGNQYPPLSLSSFKAMTLKKALIFYYPLFIGSFILGLLLAVLFYFLTLWVIKKRRKPKGPLLVLFIIMCLFLSSIETVLADEYKGEKIFYGISPMGKAQYSDLGEVSKGSRVKCVTFKTQAMGLNDTERIYIYKQSHLPMKIERDVSLWLNKEHLIEHYDQKNYVLTIDKLKNNKRIKQYVFKKNGPIQNAILLPFYLRTVGTLDIGWQIKARIPEEFVIRLKSIEEIKIPAGRFMAYHFISVPSKFEVWISKDNLRLPLKIKGLGGFGYTLVMKKYLPANKDKRGQI